MHALMWLEIGMTVIYLSEIRYQRRKRKRRMLARITKSWNLLG